MPASFDESFDYLTMLGLVVDPQKFPTVEVLRELLKKKRKEWTQQAINPLYQQQARSNLERGREFEQLLKDPAALEAYIRFNLEQQQTTRKEQEREVARLVSLARRRTKKINTEQRQMIEKYAEERGMGPLVVQEVLARAGIEVEPPDPAAAATGVPYRLPTLEATLMTQFQQYLRVVGKESFYELLDLPMGASPARIAALASTQYGRWSKMLPKTNLCLAWEKLLQGCLTYLKDDEGKAKYDNALFNQRLDGFLRRIDLVFASQKAAAEDFAELVRIGVSDFGFTPEIANRTVKQRAQARGINSGKATVVQISLTGMVRCERCLALSSQNEKKCGRCGGALQKSCGNPQCRAEYPRETRSCPRCGLSVSRSAQYAQLLKLLHESLDRGQAKTAVNACQLAQQLLPSVSLNDELQRASQIQSLLRQAKGATSRKEWNRVSSALAALHTLAPLAKPRGLPQLDDLQKSLDTFRKNLERIEPESDPQTAARYLLEWADEWSDSQEILAMMQVTCDHLERYRLWDDAVALGQRLAGLQKEAPGLAGRLKLWRERSASERDDLAKTEAALGDFRRLVAGRELYAAERALSGLTRLDLPKAAASEIERFRGTLKAYERERDSLAPRAANLADPDSFRVLLRLLEQCADDSQTLDGLDRWLRQVPDAPRLEPISWQGTKRVLRWQPAVAGALPIDYVVQRAVLRPDSRKGDAPFTTVWQGPATFFVDEDVIYNGSIVRYAVQAVCRGGIRVRGELLREFENFSRPAFAEPFVLAQEVHGLKCVRKPTGLELRWHRPAGAREILITRWLGDREAESRARADHTPRAATQEGLLLDAELVPGQWHSYRLRCVYDGPTGDFLTAGSVVSEFVPEPTGTGTLRSPSDVANEPGDGPPRDVATLDTDFAEFVESADGSDFDDVADAAGQSKGRPIDTSRATGESALPTVTTPAPSRHEIQLDEPPTDGVANGANSGDAVAADRSPAPLKPLRIWPPQS